MTIADDMGGEDLKQEVPGELRGPENREARMRWKYQIYMRDYCSVFNPSMTTSECFSTTSKSADSLRTR